MNKSELARRMMMLAIADSGLTTTEFVIRKDELLKSIDANELKRRVLSGALDK